MPMEFALLPIVESAFDPFAYSHSRASGLWQFIPSTARLYGLKIDWWYDGRRDVRTSTRAAITYLSYLNTLFDGDWLLALAAYNSGQGNVRSSIRKSSLPDDQISFWTLDLLRETRSYVPRLLAISEIIAKPEQYGISLPEIPNQPYWEAIDIRGQLDLNKAAAMAGINSRSLYTLNPGYNQWATHPDGPHELLIPVPSAEKFRIALDSLSPAERVAWHRHQILPGESLGVIAQRFNTTVRTLKSINDINGSMIRAGDSLLIPVEAAGTTYDMTSTARLEKRQQAIEQAKGSAPLLHKVVAGDSLWEISRKYNVNMRELARWNGMGTRSRLYPGTTLKVFAPKPKASSIDSPPTAAPTQIQQIRKLNYRVREGESLSLIASKFNVSVKNIESWNTGLNDQKYIHPGDHLTLYVDVTALIN